MNFVLDASVTLAWAFEDERDGAALAVLDALESREAVAASLWPLEVANGLTVAERRGRITGADAARFVRLVVALPIAVEPVSRSHALESTRRLARTHGLSAYDAAYLDVALTYGIPLASLDEGLLRAADAEGVARFEGGGGRR